VTPAQGRSRREPRVPRGRRTAEQLAELAGAPHVADPGAGANEQCDHRQPVAVAWTLGKVAERQVLERAPRLLRATNDGQRKRHSCPPDRRHRVAAAELLQGWLDLREPALLSAKREQLNGVQLPGVLRLYPAANRQGLTGEVLGFGETSF
jgi:hypothetical protein